MQPKQCERKQKYKSGNSCSLSCISTRNARQLWYLITYFTCPDERCHSHEILNCKVKVLFFRFQFCITPSTFHFYIFFFSVISRFYPTLRGCAFVHIAQALQIRLLPIYRSPLDRFCSSSQSSSSRLGAIASLVKSSSINRLDWPRLLPTAGPSCLQTYMHHCIHQSLYTGGVGVSVVTNSSLTSFPTVR